MRRMLPIIFVLALTCQTWAENTSKQTSVPTYGWIELPYAVASDDQNRATFYDLCDTLPLEDPAYRQNGVTHPFLFAFGDIYLPWHRSMVTYHQDGDTWKIIVNVPYLTDDDPQIGEVGTITGEEAADMFWHYFSRRPEWNGEPPSGPGITSEGLGIVEAVSVYDADFFMLEPPDHLMILDRGFWSKLGEIMECLGTSFESFLRDIPEVNFKFGGGTDGFYYEVSGTVPGNAFADLFAAVKSCIRL